MKLMKLNLSINHLGRRLSASLIKQSDLYIIDTEGGDRLTQFCAISSASGSVTKSECLNLFNTDTGQKTKSINLWKSKDRSKLGNSLSLMQMLTTINQYFHRSERPSVLIGHSAISADSSHLTSNMLRYYQRSRLSSSGHQERHNNIVGYVDTLFLFRALYPQLKSYKQIDLVKYFLGVPNYNAHNALDDSLMLYTLWNKFLWPEAKGNFDLLSRSSINNLYCVDRYLTKNSPSKDGKISDDKNPIRKKQLLLTKRQQLKSSKQKSSKSKCQHSNSNVIKVFQTKSVLDLLYPVLNKI